MPSYIDCAQARAYVSRVWVTGQPTPSPRGKMQTFMSSLPPLFHRRLDTCSQQVKQKAHDPPPFAQSPNTRSQVSQRPSHKIKHMPLKDAFPRQLNAQPMKSSKYDEKTRPHASQRSNYTFSRQPTLSHKPKLPRKDALVQRLLKPIVSHRSSRTRVAQLNHSPCVRPPLSLSFAPVPLSEIARSADLIPHSRHRTVSRPYRTPC